MNHYKILQNCRITLFLSLLLLAALLCIPPCHADPLSGNTSSESTESENSVDNTLQFNNDGVYAAGEPQEMGASGESLITVHVLIYNNTDAIQDSVNGIISCLEQSNLNNLVPGYRFSFSTSPIINSTFLQPYDVLIMPGGTSGRRYLNNSNITASDIKSFISAGKGYVGLCAGAYAASYEVLIPYLSTSYYGWGLAPHVSSNAVLYDGKVTVEMTSAGKTLFGLNNAPMYLLNGPAMFGQGLIPFAFFSDNITGYEGYNAIVGDYFGSGRVILSSIHPEMVVFFPNVLARMIVWAANKQTPPKPNPPNEDFSGKSNPKVVKSISMLKTGTSIDGLLIPLIVIFSLLLLIRQKNRPSHDL